MKIENTGINSLSTKLTEAAGRVDKKDERKEVHAVRSDQDKAVMSDQARLLAKARTALGNTSETGSSRVDAIQKQVESGDYKVQVNDLARKLVARFYQS